MPPLLFSTIEVSKQAFHRTALSAAIVNLKPIVPGRMSAFQSCVLLGRDALSFTIALRSRRSRDPIPRGTPTQ